MSFDFFKAIVLGIVEGLTEFLPVSSTGHLLLVNQFLGNDPARKEFWDTFSVLIQFGAILALLSIYFGRLWRLALGFFTDPAARRFVIGVLIAFLPAAVIGALAHDFIKGVLFNAGPLANTSRALTATAYLASPRRTLGGLSFSV